MTSEKYFSKWLKEAGRGHAAAFVSWGILAIYGFLTAARLSLDTNYNFFGAGSMELIWICEGLGLGLGFLECFYLFQPRKLDFYYSLPVRKETVFWSRYVHGLIHFMIPMIIVLSACGLYQSTIDRQFASAAAGYTGTAVLSAGVIFLLFYHLAVLSSVLCGNPAAAVLTALFFIFAGGGFIGGILTKYAQNCFQTYYRIPVFEKLSLLTDPVSLGGALGGSSFYEKAELLHFFPKKEYLAGAFVWIVFSFLLFASAQKKRSTERVGKAFALPMVQRAAQWILSFLAGTWLGSFSAGFGMVICGVAAAAAVHVISEGIFGEMLSCDAAENVDKRTIRKLLSGLFCHKGQIISSCGAAAAVIGIFLAGASAYDSYFPGKGETESLSVSIAGLGMDRSTYSDIIFGRERTATEYQLDRYHFTDEAKAAGTDWVKSLLEREQSGGYDSMSGTYTNAVVCWHLEDGREKYRIYSIYPEDLRAFSSVYNTEEYKDIAYPGVNQENTAEARFSWNDGVTSNVMKLGEDEKEGLVAAYREDVYDMTMEQLTGSLPAGFVEIDAERAENSGQLVVYPFFERTCRLLEKYGVQTDRTIASYPITSVEALTTVSAAEPGRSGGVTMQWYDTPEEIEQWKQKLVPVRLDLQPLLYPLGYSSEIRASVEDERSNSVLTVKCYTRIE